MSEPVLLISAYILDFVIGDPKYLPHPVKFIGYAILKIETFLRNIISKTEKAEKFAGILLVIIIAGGTYGLFFFINQLFTIHYQSALPTGQAGGKAGSLFTVLLMVYLISATLATRGLIDSVKLVSKTLYTGSIEDAREKLSHIVGRDTGRLDREGILRAAIESLAENASDGIIAPLFYFAIGGLPLAMTYKAVNTLDSMVGYRNERYKNFGWAAERLDDIANYIPARITGLLIAVSSAFVCHSLFTVHCSLRTLLRDGRKHSSPNSGIPEAAMAGALGVVLGGPSYYGGVLMEKPYIGEEKSGVRSARLESESQVSGVIKQKYDQRYLNASEDALSIVKLTSLLGLGLALILLYMRAAI